MFGVVCVAGIVLCVGSPQRTIENQMEMLLLWTQHKAELYFCFSPSCFPPWLFRFHHFQGGEIFILSVE